MANEQTWERRYERLIWAVGAILVGAAVIVTSVIVGGGTPWYLTIPSLLLLAAGALYLNVVTIWHWKERYQGKHSDLWGAFLIIEHSWSMLIYLFLHLIPDARGTGRYVKMADGRLAASISDIGGTSRK
jgi:hypothetical protein